MALVRVRNHNVHPFKQEFKGNMISLGAHGSRNDHVDMDRDDAVQFLGEFYPMVLDIDGHPTPAGYKKLFIEPIPGVVASDEPEETSDEHVCQMCKKKFKTDKDLDAHIEEAHLDELADDDEKQRRLKKRGKT